MMRPEEQAAPCVIDSSAQHQHISAAGKQSTGQEEVWPSQQGASTGDKQLGTDSRLLGMTSQTAGSSLAHSTQPAAAAAPAAWIPAAAAAPPMDLQYAEPWCVPTTVGSSRRETTGSDTAVQLLHFSWRLSPQVPDAASAPQQVATGSPLSSTGPSLHLCPAAAVQVDGVAANVHDSSSSSSDNGSSSRGSCGTALVQISCGGAAAPTELHGLLFDGPKCVADYHWPVPAVSDSSSGCYITAALQLPAAPEPQVLQLVLCCDDTWSDGRASKRIAFARCPVVYLPPGAVQEVQQVLLPAMQREVLEGWAGSQAGAAPDGTPVGMPLPLLQAAVWQHWQALADDLGLVLGLQQRLARYQEENLQQQAPQQQQARCQAAAAAAAAAATSAEGSTLGACMRQQEPAQVDYVKHQLLPVVQDYLASQGLLELLGVVERAAAAWQPQSTPAQDTGTHAAAGGDAAGMAASSSSSLGSSGKAPVECHHQQQQQCTTPSRPDMGVTTCWSGFASRLEQQYVQYKHQQYLWLDRYAACFATLWVCVLLARMALERDVHGFVMYLGYIQSKAVPYFALLAGHVAYFQRHREVAISLVSQALCLAPIVAGGLMVDPRITPHLIQGVGWAMNWLRVVIPTLIQRFWAVTTAAWPQLAALQQLPAWQQAAAGADAVDAAASRFPAAALQLHQQLARLVVLPERPMRIFWRIHGEYLVLVPMAIPQHVRLWYFVPSMLAEVAGNCYVFTWVFPWWQVVLRFTPALLLTIGVAWWFDYQARAKFLHHLQQQAVQQEQRLAAKQRSLGCAE